MADLRDEVILKPTGTVHISNRLSLVERKLLNALIWHAQSTRYEISHEEKTVPLKSVFEVIGWSDSQNHQKIRAALFTLTTTAIQWNILGEDRSKEWGVCTFLASGKLRSGKLLYRINPELAEKVSSPVLFAKIQLLMQSQLRKYHSLALYEFFIEYLSRHKVPLKGVIEDLPLVDLHSILGIGENEYQEYKIFNRNILKPVIAEVNQYSDVLVTSKPTRKNRKVVAISFSIERKTSYQIPLDFRKTKPFLARLDDGADVIEVKSELSKTDLIKRLTDKGVGKRKADNLVRQYSPEQIDANIHIVDERVATGKSDIQNVPAYLVRAIEEDYRITQSEEEKAHERAKEAKQKRQTTIDDAKKEATAIKGKFRKHLEKLSDAALERMSPTERKEFNRRFSTSKNGRTWAKQFNTEGLKSPLVRTAFYTYAIENLIGEGEVSLTEFAQQETKSKIVLKMLASSKPLT